MLDLQLILEQKEFEFIKEYFKFHKLINFQLLY